MIIAGYPIAIVGLSLLLVDLMQLSETNIENEWRTHWASSTGLTAVSKFEPRLPAQWVVGTHRKGPSRMEKVTSRMN